MSSYIVNGTCISGTCKTLEALNNASSMQHFVIALLIAGIACVVLGIYHLVVEHDQMMENNRKKKLDSIQMLKGGKNVKT